MDESIINLLPKIISPKSNRDGLYTKQEALHMQCNLEIANNVWNKIYKREIWKNIRFRESQNFEDLDIILQIIAESKNVYIFDKKLVMHRKRKGSITNSYSLKNITDKDLAFIHRIEYIHNHTPMYFTDFSGKLVLEKRIHFLYYTIFTYAISLKGNKDQTLHYLREQISEIEKTIDIKSCKLTIRVTSFMYRHTPLFVGAVIYKFCWLIRKIIKKVLK